MKVISREQGVTSFSSAHRPVAGVSPGETFWVETYDCYRGQVTDASVRRCDVDLSVANSSTGPITVEGAQPGDVLRVDVLAIELAPEGFMVVSPGMGVLGAQIDEPLTKMVRVRDGFAEFSDSLRLPLTPMIGVCGVAPPPGSDVHCAIPGDHGANMDAKIIRAGASVYLPVSVPGALLALGDLHACMGDGELSGTGIEISGRVCLRTALRRDVSIERPVVESREELYFIASDASIEAAIRTAAGDVTAFLMRRLSLSFTDAYQLMSATCDLQICQVVNRRATVRIRCPKFDTGIATL